MQGSHSPKHHKFRTIHPRRGISSLSVVVAILMLGAIAIGARYLPSSSNQTPDQGDMDLFEVVRGNFEIIIPTTGELVAKNQTEIKNQLESRAVITEIVEEGTIVSKGDILIRFNDEEIQNRLDDAEESVNSSRNDLENVQAELEIRKKTRDSENEKAKLKIELAELDLKGWEKGEVVTRRQDLALAMETAELNYNRLQERFEASQRLYEQEFISLDEFKQDQISLVEAKARHKQAKLDIEVYEKYEFQKQQKQKVSNLEQSKKEYERVKARQDAQVRQSESDVVSRQRRLDSKLDRLERHKKQLIACSIEAPQDGLVVYASSLEGFRWMRDRGMNIQVGTEMWHNQLIMILPDTSQMIAEVKINEALSGQIQPGQTATITCDASPDDVLTGVVESIGVLAENGGWRDPNRRDYTVRIRLDGDNTLDLKPSMRCQADIMIDRIDQALHIPLQAVHRQGAATFVYVPDGSGFSQRKVAFNRASELYIEISEGLDAGDRVLLREPTPEEIVAKIDPAKCKPVETNAPDDRLAKGPQQGSPESNALIQQQQPESNLITSDDSDSESEGDEDEGDITGPTTE